MLDKIDFFKLITGKKFDETYRVSNLDEVVKKQIKKNQSKYPLRLIGKGEKEVWISEEERSANFHILGAPGEGKSKFIEDQIRKDIDAGNGLCLIDPSEGGDTVQNVLSYCAKIDHKKVILIDPTTISAYGRVPCIAALNPKSVKSSVQGVMEALNILFDSKSTSTPRIRRYLTALLRVLASQNLTLKEARYFSDYHKDVQERATILGQDRDSSAIRNVFRSEFKYDSFFSSSVNRLDLLWQEPLASILGNTEGINFIEAVSKGWVILVNLSPYKLIDDEARLLGIIVISQIIQAIDLLFNKHWKGVFYLYIDEAGRFATPQIDTLLSYKRKSGLRLILAHHFNDQFDDKKVFNSIVNNARIKMMFNTPNPDDRLFAMKAMGYGGDITPTMAAFANQNIPQRYAIIKKNKETPVRIRIPDVKPFPPAPKEYIEKILSQSFYKDARSISTDSQSSEPRKTSDPKPDHAPSVPRGIQERRNKKQSVSESGKKPPISEEGEPIKI